MFFVSVHAVSISYDVCRINPKWLGSSGFVQGNELHVFLLAGSLLDFKSRPRAAEPSLVA